MSYAQQIRRAQLRRILLFYDSTCTRNPLTISSMLFTLKLYGFPQNRRAPAAFPVCGRCSNWKKWSECKVNLLFLDIYYDISFLIAVVDVLLAITSFQKNKTTGRYLAFACIGAAIVDISYLLSISLKQYFAMSVMSSIYFIPIDFMLICLLVFTVYITKGRFTRTGKTLLFLCTSYALFELFVFAVNPFREIAVHYVWRDTLIASYS